MFTLAQINAAHAKVKSGADFPTYVRDMKTLGVKNYTVQVSDGATVYIGAEGFFISSPPKYAALTINKILDKLGFEADLKLHQNGGTNYVQFCEDCAKSGIAGWVMSLTKNTCSYFDEKGTTILTELIPT